MKCTLLLCCLTLTACAPMPCDTGGSGGASPSTGEGGTTTSSSSTGVTCDPGLAFDLEADFSRHLGGTASALPSGTLIAARFPPFAVTTLAAPLVYLRIDPDHGCELPGDILSAAWTEPTAEPTIDPFVTQSLISADMVKSTADPAVVRVRLDPVTYAAPEPFQQYAFHAVVLVPHLCPVLVAPACEDNGFLMTINGWSRLSTITDASPGLGLYTDPP